MTAFDVPLGPASGVPGATTVSSETGRLGSRREWQAVYIRRLLISDTLVVIAAVALAQWIRFGAGDALASYEAIHNLSYTLISAALIAMWIGALVVFRTRSVRVIGAGAEEYRRIFVATVRLFGLIAIVSLLFRLDLARLYLAIAFPVGLAGLLLSRWCWRQAIARKRARGEFQTSVLVVGGERAVRNLTESFARGTAEGYRVVGVCMPGHTGEHGDTITVGGRVIPVLGNERDVVDSLQFCHADTVAVTATEHLGHEGMRDLAWALEPHEVDLVVAPGMMDVAGPRLSMRPVAGLPLIHVEKPQFHGSNKFAKTAFDLVAALLVLVALAPVMLIVAAIIKIGDRGPIFYRQERVGLNGETFRMWKFRSMVPNADKKFAAIREALGQSEGTFFKSAKDPRITPIGRFIRKTSVDELPQLFNVLTRDMSMVGPRPLIEGEGLGVPGFVERRMLVRPGMTGLWQVSGRSALSEEDRIRLDLFYVENWSMTQDLLIIGKTVRAVIGSDGAY
ncbi:Undecaprenyl-phosphate galactose phosphotransferase WbaP/exopolysaccharide biosynthesis polyprenyl glycosylphosphotransferase [Rhodococcus wratislaviensis]|uniref:sugar transferase n=1 Tax=Rhodococcus wratislaviensis TaxID=44752 RepID=UPI000DD3C125|nr:sugar transferase [Rhodococcus wratislaviensis]REE73016.1 Undecaprenyl-phosphate galactose phosphotransferase WbaP/exopolysaccharide biosynthesis polyprenyl glycosylphosphotransferase [Rhodococcus wratislaviensis]